MSPVGQYPITLAGGSGTNYLTVLIDGTLTVTNQTIPVVSWSNPAPIVYGMPLGAAQLNATASCGPTPLNNSNAQFV